MRPGPELAPETRAEELGDDADVPSRNLEHLRHDSLQVEDRLRRFVDRQFVAFPNRGRALQLDRVVRLDRRDVSLVELNRRTRKSLLGLAAFALLAFERT